MPRIRSQDITDFHFSMDEITREDLETEIPHWADVDEKGNVHILAHRFAWMLANMCDIPLGYDVYQNCGNHYCCNPDHLYLDAAGKGNHGGASKRIQ